MTAAEAPSAPALLSGAPYEVLPLDSPALRAEAHALVVERIRWLRDRSLPYDSHAPALYCEKRMEPVGLVEDGRLIGCVLLNRRPDLQHWGAQGQGECLAFIQAYSAVGSVSIGRLMTLWASDFAARLGVPCVRAEIPEFHRGPLVLAGRLLRYAEHLGWTVPGYGAGLRLGQRVARIELPAELRPNLSHLIRCTVPLLPRPAATTAAGDDTC